MRYNKDMFIVGLLGWWYSAGWRARAIVVRQRLARAFDFFSIDLLVKTWFAPFRQISAGKVSGPIGAQLRAWADRMISRIIGGIVRTFVIISGAVWLLVLAVIGVVELGVWLLIPLSPLAGVFLMSLGWVPAW